MKINKKALFFDIDGTLFSEKLRQVPQSAVLALKKTMEKGNLTFINTGRTWCQTSKIREEAPVNGLLCGCGTYISVDGKTLYDQRISPERAEKLKEDILRFRMDTVMEGVDACFFRPDGVRTETMRAIRSILDQSGSVSAKNWSDPSFSISKFCVAVGADSDPAGFFETLRDFEVIDRGGGFYECVPMGHSKASAIEWILKQYGIALEDAWVFGDSMNDLSMFQYVPNTVVMGKHDAGLEPYATFTAKTVEEDGIYQNYVDDSVRQLYDMLDFPHPPLRPLRGNGGKEVYQLIAFFSPGHEERIMSVLPHCEATRWNPLFADVVPRGSSKAVGIDKIIEYYGISLHETMAFGDGGNDMAMLRHAGIGVAMGNAGDEVKEAADYVTDSVDDDGVMNALRHFDVI